MYGIVCAEFFDDLYANQIAVYLLWIWNWFKRHVFTYVLCAFIPTSNSMFRVNSFSILLYLSLSVYFSFFFLYRHYLIQQYSTITKYIL